MTSPKNSRKAQSALHYGQKLTTPAPALCTNAKDTVRPAGQRTIRGTENIKSNTKKFYEQLNVQNASLINHLCGPKDISVNSAPTEPLRHRIIPTAPPHYTHCATDLCPFHHCLASARSTIFNVLSNNSELA